jgi:CopA family copper-resistance protein
MTLVQADGQNVEPVSIEEFRIAPAETYDMIAELSEDRAYAIFAETMDRSGYAAAFLAPRDGMRAPLPPRRPRPVRTMADMGMAGGMDSGPGRGGDGMKMSPADESTEPHAGMPGMEKPAGQPAGPEQAPPPAMHGPDHHGPGNSMVAMTPISRLNDPGTGLEGSDRRVLVYTDLRRLTPAEDQRPPGREIKMHLTGNMERQMWSIDGKKYSEATDPIPLRYGERVRITLVNDTMMDHPMHLHGMWMALDNGAGPRMPYKHTINVKAGERLSFIVTPDEAGPFAFHCHLFFHMELGMFRVVSVAPASRKQP